MRYGDIEVVKKVLREGIEALEKIQEFNHKVNRSTPINDVIEAYKQVAPFLTKARKISSVKLGGGVTPEWLNSDHVNVNGDNLLNLKVLSEYVSTLEKFKNKDINNRISKDLLHKEIASLLNMPSYNKTHVCAIDCALKYCNVSRQELAEWHKEYQSIIDFARL